MPELLQMYFPQLPHIDTNTVFYWNDFLSSDPVCDPLITLPLPHLLPFYPYTAV